MRLNNGFEIPQIGVGTWTLRGETARQNVRLALQAGFRHVDTAQMYENESEVGLGIADSGVLRSEIFVTTKVSTSVMRNGSEAVRQSIDESLARLNTGYIDLLLIHWPVKDCVRDTWQVMGAVRTGRHRRHRASALAVAGREVPKDGFADCAPLDYTTRPDYNSPRQAQPLQGKSGHHGVLALQRRHAGHQRPEPEPAFERAQRPRDIPVVTLNETIWQ